MYSNKILYESMMMMLMSKKALDLYLEMANRLSRPGPQRD